MNKIPLVLKNELISVISRRSYIITLLLVPVLTIAMVIVLSTLGAGATQAIGQIVGGTPSQMIKEGYVDESGLVRQLPTWLQAGRLTGYASQDAAQQALSRGQISAFYIVTPDYLADGKLIYVRADFNPMTGIEQSYIFESVLRYNLVGGDQALAARLEQPLQLETVSLSTQPQREQSNALTFFLPYAVTMLFYIVILTSATLMLNSVTTEKQNRVLEILMVSLTPTQMLVGKIIALGLAGLLQTLVWSGAGFLLLRLSGRSLNIPAAFQLPVSILAWGGLFFLLGYAVYASLMAGVGALVPNLREASQATTVMIVPLIIPLVLMSSLINDSASPMALAISLFPLTAPVAMMTRLAAGPVPFWQPALAAVLLLLTDILVIRAVAGMFRAQTLLSGQEFNLRRYLSALAGRG